MYKKRFITQLLTLFIMVSLFNFAPAATTVYAVDAEEVPSLLITELVVNSKNVGGMDGYEYIEIYNNSGKSVKLSDYKILYRYPDYPTTADLVWDITSATVIPDKAFFIVWLKNMSNPEVNALTTDDFLVEYYYEGVTPPFRYFMNPDRITAVDSTNMANGSSRTIILARDNGTIISKASYTASDVTAAGTNESDPKKSIHFRYNDDDASSDKKQMIKMGAGNANPGRYVTSSNWDQVHRYPQSHATGTPELMITELCPSTSNVGTADGYEFIEVYNNRASSIAIDGYHINYAGTVWQISGTGISVAPKGSVVLWIKNGQNTATTKQQFKDFYNISMNEANIIELACGGMSNTAARTISIVKDSTGAVIASVSYDPAVGDVVENKGIEYMLNPSNKTLTQLVKMGVNTASPGIVTIDQGLAPWYSYSENFNIPMHDYSFAVIPDPQYYVYPQTKQAQVDMMYYLGNAEKYGIKNLVHAMCVGDMVDKYDDTSQWTTADASFDILDAEGVSYGTVSGNHDVSTTDASHANYHTWFGYQRFSNKPGFGGYHLNSASKTDGIYFTFTQGSDKFIILYLGYNVETSSGLRTWAKNILDANTDKTGIIITHAYFTGAGDGYSGGDIDEISPGARTYSRSAAGNTVYNDIVVPCSNVRYVICGHVHGVAKQSVTLGNRTVHELMFDFQAAATPHAIKAYSDIYNGANGAHFGMGMMTMMFVDKANNKIHFRTYSPWAQKNSWFDKFGNFDNFDIPLSLVGQ